MDSPITCKIERESTSVGRVYFFMINENIYLSTSHFDYKTKLFDYKSGSSPTKMASHFTNMKFSIYKVAFPCTKQHLTLLFSNRVWDGLKRQKMILQKIIVSYNFLIEN